ncbi:MAG: DNA polymerase IV [Candidatus Komeilibacteria bacterium CG_4_10_14_0_2_um_filter_37_10]|uniref:DNA polymerase IV n=1 Tax=Candidatus Komeilibacteria bacterium CG_4_10_14_0_2_um_filter_37_10 TaxID=1974470 RepID=A0A2M7VF57_9BACT|nr:MAG: DNA polymerase IV [Candidatus Komeilibacteria bacterium CG_4_10_14_0_2_um_filter_37_10]
MEKEKGNTNLLLRSWPQAIMHLDADAFFASCEQSLRPELKGRPVVTGAERGIVSAASYEAKALGIGRGIPLWQVQKICPRAVILPSDYESYSLISLRIFDIMRQYIPQVEEYSIDEAFADLTGLRRPLHASYYQIAKKIQKQIETELNLTVSIGVSLSKSLAKLAANWHKPAGLTIVPSQLIEQLLRANSLATIWGFGSSTVNYLQKFGLKNAYDFAYQSEYWVKTHLNKTGLEIWRELHGEAVYPVNPAIKHSYQSISKMKTFSPPSADKKYVWAQLIRNLESACIKARRHQLVATKVIIYLREQNFQSQGLEIKLNQPTNSALLITPVLQSTFQKLFSRHGSYRTTGIVLTNLQTDQCVQESLFANQVKILKMERLAKVIDEINYRFGKHTIHQATSLPINSISRGQKRHTTSPRWTQTFRGENLRQHLYLPRWLAPAN